MKTWIRKSFKVGVLSAGLLLFAASSAQADTTQVSVDNNGIANGTQVAIPIQVPVNVCGNGIGALVGVGIGLNGACINGAAQDVSHHAHDHHGHNGHHKGSLRKKGKRKGYTESSRTEDTTQLSAGNNGILNGTQIFVPVQIPINICGNGVGVLGVGVGLNGVCSNFAAQDVSQHRHGKGNHKKKYAGEIAPSRSAAARTESVRTSDRTEDTTQVSAGNNGILNGTQVFVPVQIPINICGNGIGALVGLGIGANGACINGASQDVDSHGRSHQETRATAAERGRPAAGRSGVSRSGQQTEDTTQVSSGNNGILNGTQLYVPIQIPINICGNGVGVLGVGVGLNGACINGAAHNIDNDGGTGHHQNVDDDDDDDDDRKGHQARHAKKNNGKYGRHSKRDNYRKADRALVGEPEMLPAPGLASINSVPVLGGAAKGLPLSNLGTGLRSTKMNVAGIDPAQLLPTAQMPTLSDLPAGLPTMR